MNPTIPEVGRYVDHCLPDNAVTTPGQRCDNTLSMLPGIHWP